MNCTVVKPALESKKEPDYPYLARGKYSPHDEKLYYVIAKNHGVWIGQGINGQKFGFLDENCLEPLKGKVVLDIA